MDSRGSEGQRFFNNLTRKLYPKYNVIHEQYIPELNMRYDIFVVELGIAIEFDGIQHDKYVEFFHGSVENYFDAIKKDISKDEWSRDNGIKMIRIKTTDGYDLNTFKKLIEETEYPEADYNPAVLDKPERKDLARAREYRKERYRSTKT